MQLDTRFPTIEKHTSMHFKGLEPKVLLNNVVPVGLETGVKQLDFALALQNTLTGAGL